MYKNLNAKGLGAFDGVYWSSSETNPNDAWVQGFSAGRQSDDSQAYGSKTYAESVRAVRAF
jgi:hypothetical protein